MRKKPLLIALAAIGLSGAAHAQYPVSPQRGIVPVTIAGAPQLTAVGAPFIRETVAYGTVTTVTGTTLTFTTTSGSFSGVGPDPLSVIFLTGSNRGFNLPIVAGSGSSITVSGSLPALPVSGTGSEIQIIKDWTLNSLIGDGSTKPLPIGFSATDAFVSAESDQVFIINSDGNFEAQYLYDDGSIKQWRRVAGDAPTGNLRINLGNGCIIKRATLTGTSPMILDLEGEMQVGQRNILAKDQVLPSGHRGNTIVANVYSNDSTPSTVLEFGQFLLNSGLNAADSDVSGDLDRLAIVKSDGTIEDLFFDTDASPVGWYAFDGNPSTNFNATSLPMGSAVIVKRIGIVSTTDLNIIIPQKFNP